MMLSDHHHYLHHHQAPPWPEAEIHVTSPTPQSPPSNSSPTASYAAVMASLRRYLFSTADPDPPPTADFADEMDFPSGDDDEFFMYEFKVRKCNRARAHDWTECPFAHPGEKARRRDPRKYNYSGTACSDFRKGGCKKGDHCEFAHGVFECWLHPARYRTQACKDGPGCRRRVCFFAHRSDQLRAGSGLTSPIGSQHSITTDYPDDVVLSVGDATSLVASFRNLQLNKVKSMPSSWAGPSLQIGSPVFGSPRGGSPAVARPGFFSLPATPTRPGIGYSDFDCDGGEEAVMQRVESGRALRNRMFEKLSKENPLSRPGPVETQSGPDFGWVSDLIK